MLQREIHDTVNQVTGDGEIINLGISGSKEEEKGRSQKSMDHGTESQKSMDHGTD